MLISENISLLPFNTFHIDVKAKYFADVKNENDFSELLQEEKFRSQQKLILGGGSNILFTKNFDGIVVKNSFTGISIVKEDENYVWVKAAAGEVWHQFVLWCIEKNLAGLENLSLIPGQVGAAPMQNIGAYGVEIKDVFDELEAVEIVTGEKVNFKNAECEFGYRESVFKNKFKNQFLISAVTFRLNKIPKFNVNYGDIKMTLDEMRVNELTIKAVSDAVIKIRTSKLPDPKVLGNAGSFFKNPVITKEEFDIFISKNPLANNYPQKDGTVKVPAGWLIEQCGWKGKIVGHTGSHKSQALVLVNYGGATGNEVYQLALDIQKSVHDKFGITIQPEVNLV
ncbi:UDP-N-acetylenolpyruvoylglucosamine reductase [Bacteroidota bacterium]|nr:UDP-N-acetylenolpyruvoylglucosamine reductase [Bacteroidota bacterium]